MYKKIVSLLLSVILILASSTAAFAQTETVPQLTMSFFSMPEKIIWGTEHTFGVEFHMPDGVQYTVQGIGYVQGMNVAETYNEFTVKNNDRITLTVPAYYNYADAHNYDFVYTVAGIGEWSALGAVSISSATESAKQKIKPLVIPATVKYNTSGYHYASLTGYAAYVSAGSTVEYMNPDSSKSMRSARIKLSDGTVCWVPMSAISISTKNHTISDNLINAEREAFVNMMGYSSKTDYLIWVNKERQMLTLFLGSQGNWKVVRNFYVATGKNTTPTPTKVCEYTYRTGWYTPSYSCQTVLYLYDGYAIHNQPVSPAGYVKDKTLGAPASAGCIRMLLSDVNWLASYVTVGSTVVLY